MALAPVTAMAAAPPPATAMAPVMVMVVIMFITIATSNKCGVIIYKRYNSNLGSLKIPLVG